MNAVMLVACLVGPPAEGADGGQAIDRGRYLVHGVAMCVVCHSPRDSEGDLLEGGC